MKKNDILYLFANNEEIYGGEGMVILDLKVDNFFAFKDFHVNFTYPKKIVGSYIEDEYLLGRKNFRYKKVNIIMGANATGKTTLGLILMDIFNLIERKNYVLLTENISNPKKSASFTIELASDSYKMYRINCQIDAKKNLDYSDSDIRMHVESVDIGLRDSYEICKEKLDKKMNLKQKTNMLDELEKVERLFWLFETPADFKSELNLPKNDAIFIEVLRKTLMALDSSITAVEKVKDISGAYRIKLTDRQIIIQDGERVTTKVLSSGTKAGIGVACVIDSVLQGKNRFYYCDEKFSYIHSDIEKAVLGLMIDKIRPNEQLFFTTHNTEILDMNLPKHSFMFMKKDNYGEESIIECVQADTFLKRNTDSLKKAVENDLFSVAPSTDLIYEIGYLFD